MFYKIHIETATGEQDTTCMASEWDSYLAKLEANDTITHYSVEGPFEEDANLRHLNSLIAHGAKIGCGEVCGQPIRIDLDEQFYDAHLHFIRNQPAITALTFDLFLPGIDEAFALTIWEDGHIDSGSKENMQRVLDR